VSEDETWEVVVFERVRILAFVYTVKEEFFDEAEEDVEDCEENGNNSDNVVGNE
jgi:hypothetical protein